MKKGWETKRMGEVLAILRNGVNCKQDKKGQGDRISRIESISTANFDIDKVGYTVLSKSDKEKYRLNKGDILFSHINSPIHVGKTALFNSEEEVYHGVNLLLMRPKPFLDVKYLELYLKFLFQKGYWMRLCKQSVNQASVNQQDINKVEISFPLTLQEQRRIVFSIDEAFASIGKAKANAEQNLKNARELFESYLQSVFENKNFYHLEFGKVCELVGGSQPSKKEFVYEPKEGYIRLIQVRDYRTDKFKTYIPKSLAKRFCSKDDIMIGRYGPPIFGIFKGLEGAYNVALMKAIVNEDYCNRDYFYWFLNTDKIRRFVENSSKRAVGQDGVRKELLYEYPVPVPSLKQQQSIINQLDSLNIQTQKLETIYQEKIENLGDLKKSILQKAFAGEFTEKEIAL